MAITVDSSLILDSLLRKARANEGGAKAFITPYFDKAFEAVMNGDEFATSLNNDGAGSTWARNVPAVTLLALCEKALKIIDEEEGLEEGETANKSSSMTYSDFSGGPCNLG